MHSSATRLATATHQATATREDLVRLLGLDEAQAQALTLPGRLPELPEAPRELPVGKVLGEGLVVGGVTGLVGAGGAITDLKKVADRGGESAAVGPDGTVYVANGQIFIYGPDGKQTGRIDVPARPLQLIFGGADRRTLFILTHHALYATRI